MTDPKPDDPTGGEPPVPDNKDDANGQAAPTAPAAAPLLDRVFDDTGGCDEAAEWAADELVRGRPFEEVSADLLGRGWSAESAGEIVEEARAATRRRRGVRTRADVARGVARRYARSVRLVRWLVVLGIVGLVVVVSMVLRG